MIDDMALLKRTMQQMDAEDPTVAQAAKDRAAQILSEAKLNFAKMAELIEQRRLLLAPAILARIRKMDQPGMLGDAAFQDTGTALRREGQSFLRIAEAIEASGRPAPGPAPRYEAPVQESEPHFFAMEDRPDQSRWLRALFLVGRILLFPVRHPLRSLAIALFALVLLYGVRAVVVLAERLSGSSNDVAAVHRIDTAISSVGSFINERILRRAKEENASPTPSAPVPSPTVAATPSSAAPATTSPPPATPSPAPSAAPTPSAARSPAPAAASAPPTSAPPPAQNESAAVAPPAAAPALPPATPASPPDWTPRRDARSSAPSRSPANRPRTLEEDLTGFSRNSRMARPCRGGVGGCYWGGARF
jgi:hypothetical protein